MLGILTLLTATLELQKTIFVHRYLLLFKIYF